MALRILQFCAVFAIGYSKGSDSSFGKSVFQPPAIDLSLNLTDPEDVVVKKGHNATLRCDVHSSIDGLQVTWIYKNETIPSNDTRWILQSDYSLFIPKVASGKRFNGVTGEYQCLARNRAGALLSNVAKLKIASMEKSFSREPSDLSVPESQPAVLHCNILSTPPAVIQWEYNNLPLLQNTRYVPLSNGALFISNSQYNDSGYYRCKAINSILNKVKNSAKAILKVTPSPVKAESPSFLPLDISKNKTVIVGEEIHLYCAVKGWPLPIIQWIYNDDHVILSNNSHFHIKYVDIHHSGRYTCLAQNIHGISRLDYFLQVHQLPYFNVRPQSREYPMASTLRLECEAAGTPQPKLQWLKDGKPLSLDGVSRKQQSSGHLVVSQIFSKDSGIYQCVAVNTIGKVWTAARIEINVSQSPSPPKNLICRPFDATSVCLTWQATSNVTVQAYSIHSLYEVEGVTKSGLEHLSKVTYYHVMGLNPSTNYTFYVRVYSNVASDSSEKVTCKTDIVDNRNVDIEYTEPGSVVLNWSEISTDKSCDGFKDTYKVEWRKEGYLSANVEETVSQSIILPGLVPGVDYEFRIFSNNPKDRETAPWVLYTVPDHNVSKFEEKYNNLTLPLAPRQLEGQALSTTSIKLSWLNFEKNYKYFTVCYVDVVDGQNCEAGMLVKSFSNKLVLHKLDPNTLYKFKVRAHGPDGTPGKYSQSIEIHTPADVPSSVQDLKYKVLNDTAACLSWQAPLHENGAKLIKYIVSYTPDTNWPLEKWIEMSVPIYSAQSISRCWPNDEKDYITAMLANLSSEAQYIVLVRAVSDIGVGKPVVPIVVTTKVIAEVPKPDLHNEIKYHKKVGIIIGTIASLICIICCIACILVRRRCLKRRAIARARTAASNNYYPASARYASRVGRVQVRLAQPCLAVVGERENDSLVISGTHPNSNIIPVTASIFDTKVSNHSNGHLNGSTKPTFNNLNLSNTNVHITENPQFYAYETNGQTTDRKIKPLTLSLSFEEDSNSNVKPSKFYDLYRLFENSKKCKSGVYDHHHQCDPHFEDRVQEIHSSRDSGEFSPDSTQLTCLDESLNEMANTRRVSPILGPNG